MRAVLLAVPTAVLLTACAGEAPREASAEAPATVAAAPDARPCPEIDRDTVVVRGRIERRPYRGPPGFGEDTTADARLEAAILVLDEPIDVCAGPGPGGTPAPVRATEMHLAFDTDSARVPDGVVELEGIPFERVTGYHRTPVLLQVLSPPPGAR